MRNLYLLLCLLYCLCSARCNQTSVANSINHNDADTLPSTPLSVAGLKLYNPKIIYNAAYVSIPYPMGDVPATQGVCADVIVRAFRGIGVDLQKLVHEDMCLHFKEYPKLWRLKQPDKNIDHRRVTNLMRYFERMGMALPITKNAKNYLPGDVIAWQLPNEL